MLASAFLERNDRERDAALALTSDIAVSEVSPKGLGGWLILVGFGLIVGLVYRAFLILQNVHLSANGIVRSMSDSYSAAYVPGFADILHFELIAHIAILAFNILLAILFVRESRKFPRCFMAFLCAIVIYAAVDHFMFAHAVAGSSQQMQQRFQHILEDGLRRIISSAVGAAIWVAYMAKSKRVKASFVR